MSDFGVDYAANSCEIFNILVLLYIGLRLNNQTLAFELDIM